MNILAIDRQVYGSDTMSTHALMRTGVLQLEAMGIVAGSKGPPEHRKFAPRHFTMGLGEYAASEHQTGVWRRVSLRAKADRARPHSSSMPPATRAPMCVTASFSLAFRSIPMAVRRPHC